MKKTKKKKKNKKIMGKHLISFVGKSFVALEKEQY
jgi:hypothetical protein